VIGGSWTHGRTKALQLEVYPGDSGATTTTMDGARNALLQRVARAKSCGNRIRVSEGRIPRTVLGLGSGDWARWLR